MPPQPGQLVVWECRRASFMVGFRKDGTIVLTCIDDGDESMHASEEVARTFAEHYVPREDGESDRIAR